MPDVALLGPNIALLKPVLRNNWKVPEHVCNSLVLLPNIRRAAIVDPREACYLLNFAKNSQFSGECPGETGSHVTAHTTIQSSQTAHFGGGLQRGRFCGDFAGIVTGLSVSVDISGL
jgi:hypothetical protein